MELKDWQGVFYPPDLPRDKWLPFCARYFSAVEVNSTFYSAPSAKAVAHWMEQTPEDFCFNCKMPKEITHDMKLRDCKER